nr:hypothetical protein [Candidatus Enterousia merdequi]
MAQQTYKMRLFKIIGTEDVYIDNLLRSDNIQDSETLGCGFDNFLFVRKTVSDDHIELYVARSDKNDIAIVQNNNITEQKLEEGQTAIHQGMFCIIYHNYVLLVTEKNMQIYWLKQYLKIKFNAEYKIEPVVVDNLATHIKDVSGIQFAGLQDIQSDDEAVNNILKKTKESASADLFQKYEMGIVISLVPKRFPKKLDLQRNVMEKQQEIDNTVKIFVENCESDNFLIRLKNGKYVNSNKFYVSGIFTMPNVLNLEFRTDKIFTILREWKNKLIADRTIKNDVK